MQRIVFHPLIVLAISLAAALVFALVVVIRFEGDFRFFLLYYFAPIGVPFVAFLLDRAEQGRIARPIRWVIDLPVLTLSLARAVVLVPWVSGHALFLTYSLLSTRTWVARLTSAAVLLEVIYLKVFRWHDATLLGGMALGVIAAFIDFLLLRRGTGLKLPQPGGRGSAEPLPEHGEAPARREARPPTAISFFKG